MLLDEFLASPQWKIVYEECWRIWREGLDLLRKAEDGRSAERAKQMMADAERILRTPLSLKLPAEDTSPGRYTNTLAGREEKSLREELNRSIEER